MVYAGTDTAVAQGPDGLVEKTSFSYRFTKANFPKSIARFEDQTESTHLFSHLRSCYTIWLPDQKKEKKVVMLY